MATSSGEKPYPIFDLSGAVQRKTTKFMSSANQVDLAINADFSRVGGVQKILGHERLGNTITTSTTSSSTTTSTSTSSTTSTSSSTSTSTSTSSSTSTTTTSTSSSTTTT